jgi:two-component system, response regulator
MSEVEILLVEDSPDDVEMTLHALRSGRLASRIAVVRDGAEAIEFLFCEGAFAARRIADVPKVVLLDLKLPKIDGKEVLRLIKADPRTHGIPVVVLTSSQEQSDIEACYALGVNSFIVKPVSFELFVEAVRQLGIYWLMLNQPPEPL